MERFDRISNELSFCELRCKEVINVVDGKRLGRICDIIFSRHAAKVCGFIVPGTIKGGWFRKCEDVFIPYNNICKIGIDVILVELTTGICAEKLLEIHGK